MIASKNIRLLLKLPAPLIAAFLWFLSAQSTLPEIKGVLGWDKLQHMLAYAALAGAAGLWASPEYWKRRPVLGLLFSALAASAYGAIDEFHQYFVPGRQCDVWDWFADTLGALAGAAAIMFVMRIYRSHKMTSGENSN